MQIFTLKNPFILGDEPHEKYGWSWRSETDKELPVQFSSHQQTILPGTRILAEKAELKTAKSSGKQYMWLSGVKVEDSPVSAEEQVPFEEKPEPTFEKSEKIDKPKDDKYLKDVTDIPVRFMLHCLQYFDAQTLASNPSQYEAYMELVKLLSEDALKMIENVRND